LAAFIVSDQMLDAVVEAGKIWIDSMDVTKPRKIRIHRMRIS